MRGDLQAPSGHAPVLQTEKLKVREGEVAAPPEQPNVLSIHYCSGLAACQAAATCWGQCGDRQTWLLRARSIHSTGGIRKQTDESRKDGQVRAALERGCAGSEGRGCGQAGEPRTSGKAVREVTRTVTSPAVSCQHTWDWTGQGHPLSPLGSRDRRP